MEQGSIHTAFYCCRSSFFRTFVHPRYPRHTQAGLRLTRFFLAGKNGEVMAQFEERPEMPVDYAIEVKTNLNNTGHPQPGSQTLHFGFDRDHQLWYEINKHVWNGWSDEYHHVTVVDTPCNACHAHYRFSVYEYQMNWNFLPPPGRTAWAISETASNKAKRNAKRAEKRESQASTTLSAFGDRDNTPEQGEAGKTQA